MENCKNLYAKRELCSDKAIDKFICTLVPEDWAEMYSFMEIFFVSLKQSYVNKTSSRINNSTFLSSRLVRRAYYIPDPCH